MSGEAARFGVYELVRPLGIGGMAHTHVALRRGPGEFEQLLCLKRIRPTLETNLEFVRLFLEEARVAASLRHGNIVQVYDFGEHGGTHFLALELVEGMDLRKLLESLQQRSECMAANLVGTLAVELASALDYAHGAGVIHRDLSPSNVLVSVTGEVKLTDFGIAKVVARHGTHSGVIKGKVPYMAPEYASTGRFSVQNDLFALGVTLFECLAGQRPFEGTHQLEVLQRATHGDHPPLAQLAAEAPAALVACIEKLIRPQPSDRFATASELLDALSTIAIPMTTRRQLAQLVNRHAAPQQRDVPPQEIGTAPPQLPVTLLAHKPAGATAETVAVTAVAANHAPGGIMRRWRRPPPWTVGMVAFGVASSLGWWGMQARSFRQPDASPPAPRSATVARPALQPAIAVPQPTPTMPPLPTTVAATASHPKPKTSAPSPTRAKGTLHIDSAAADLVWVDGRLLGAAPQSVRLPPGEHAVAAGPQSPVMRRSVTMVAGKTLRLHFP